ncbi:MAG: M1 family metallopeptidase [Flavobacteriales bacterium]|nr:M1 family metallopeptidase [Flavobacteriales bacterium]
MHQSTCNVACDDPLGRSPEALHSIAHADTFADMFKKSLALSMVLVGAVAHAQLGDGQNTFTHADTLRGSIGPYRAWWNVVGYDVTVRPDFETRSIVGRTIIAFDAVEAGGRMQIDLQQPLVVDSIVADVAEFKDGAIAVSYKTIPFSREENVIWVDLPQAMKKGEATTITISYHGVPRAARNPPWDGGWIWKKDEQGNPWMSVACQGLGASVWYPCKDHQSDEPEYGANLHITVPDSLQAIGNGRLRNKQKNSDGTTTWNWQVKNPINTYNLVPYIGKYTHFHEDFVGVKGPLDLDYWVLAFNEAKAREHFKQVPLMLKCFEEWLGPYPFYEDGYKLVEAPHLGMEHQSAVAYGNKYQNGYLGMDLSGTGRGLLWDFIIVHESGHEWFGNSITTADIADMWVHEGITQYTEVIYTECQQGKEAAEDYVIGLRNKIGNRSPVIGPYGVNQEGNGDMYPKGANLMHTIRHIVGDSTFKAMLLEMNRKFYLKVTTSAEIEDFMINYNERTKAMLNKSIFDQYLRTTQIPVLEWGIFKRALWARWSDDTPDLKMCGGFMRNGQSRSVPLGTSFRRIASGVAKETEVGIDRNWYIDTKRVNRKTIKAHRSMQPRVITDPVW